MNLTVTKTAQKIAQTIHKTSVFSQISYQMSWNKNHLKTDLNKYCISDPKIFYFGLNCANHQYSTNTNWLTCRIYEKERIQVFYYVRQAA